MDKINELKTALSLCEKLHELASILLDYYENKFNDIHLDREDKKAYEKEEDWIF